jgi:tetratricopeptide (TPR) repeat protein
MTAKFTQVAALALVLILVACSPNSKTTTAASNNLYAQPQKTGLSSAILTANYALKNSDFLTACSIFKQILSSESSPETPLFLYQQALLSFLACDQVPQALKIAQTIENISTPSELTTLTLSVHALAQNQPAFRKSDLLAPYPELLFNRISSYWNLQLLPKTSQNQSFLSQLSQRKFHVTSITRFEEVSIITTELFQQGLVFAHQGQFLKALKLWQVVLTNLSNSNTSRLTLLMAHAQSLAGNQKEALKLINESPFLDDPLLKRTADQLKNQNKILPNIFSNPRDNLAEALFFAALINRDRYPLRSIILLALAQYSAEHISPSLYAFEKTKILVKANRNQDAFRIINSIPENAPYFLIAMEQKALLLHDEGQIDETISLLKKLFRAQPNNINLLLSIADIHRRAKDYPNAILTYNQIIDTIKHNPKKEYWVYYFYRGMTFEQFGRWPAAEQDMIFALNLNPNRAEVLNYLGYSWIDRNINLKRGKNMLEQALTLSPNDYAILDSVGWAHFQLKEYKKAVEHLEKAIQLGPLDPIVNDHLGDSYWKIGRKKEAFYQWRRALQLSPDKDHTSELLNKSINGLPPETQPNSLTE